MPAILTLPELRRVMSLAPIAKRQIGAVAWKSKEIARRR